jgi:hypothetical protein
MPIRNTGLEKDVFYLLLLRNAAMHVEGGEAAVTGEPEVGEFGLPVHVNRTQFQHQATPSHLLVIK